MKKKDPNYVVKLENAIKEKYGEDAIQHPKRDWNEEKEKQYLGDLKKLYASRREDETPDKVEINGVFVASKLIWSL